MRPKVEQKRRSRKARQNRRLAPACAGSPDIADEFRVKPADVRLFLQGQLDPARTRELTEQMLVAGLPV